MGSSEALWLVLCALTCDVVEVVDYCSRLRGSKSWHGGGCVGGVRGDHAPTGSTECAGLTLSTAFPRLLSGRCEASRA